VHKAVIFDLDGVLVDTPDMHYETFSQAYYKYTNIVITKKEHDIDFNGRSTKTKLKILQKRDSFSDELFEKIWSEKQLLTWDYIDRYLQVDHEKVLLLQKLKQEGLQLACASNCIKDTLLKILNKIGLLNFFDLVLSNEDVHNPKPSSEIYLKAMIGLNCNPTNTLIIEDSQIGFEAAINTKADVLRVINSKDVTFEKIKNSLLLHKEKTMKHKYKNDKLKIIIPMAGAGSRFALSGYVFPKPLIEVRGKTMIKTVIDSLNIDAQFVFIARKEHDEKYNIENYLKTIVPECDVVFTDGLTEGAACTVLLAKDYIDNDDPIIIANSDQWIKWDVFEFMKYNINNNLDASMLTFESTHPKWSFAKINDGGLVTEVAEKNPISNIATVGVYWWAKGADFVKYAESMISNNIRINNEFYVCPVFNEAIKDDKKIGVFNVDEMFGLGTPEDLNSYLAKYP
jgi:hypothetical protein